MAIANASHDISLQQDSSATEYGFMLAKEKGAKQWQVDDADTLSPQYFSAAASYANSPPEQEQTIAQDEWHAGYGLQDSALGEEKRYRTSYGVDARQKGRVYNGPAATTLTLPTSMAPVILNPGFEAATLGSLPDNWTAAVGGTVIASNTSVHGGTLSCYTAATCRASQALLDSSGVFNPIWKSSTITVSAWVARSGAGTTRVGIDDGSGTTWSTSATVTGTATEQLSVTKTLAATAVSATVFLDETITNSYWDDLTIAGTSASTGDYVRYIDYNSKLYLARGTSLLSWAGTATSWSYVTGFANVITDMAVLADRLVVATGTANFYFYSGTASDTVFTAATVAGNKAQFLQEIGGTLYFNSATSTITNVTAVNGTPATTTTVGLTTTPITSLESHTGLLYIGKTDQPYERSSAGAITAIMPEAVSEASTTSCKNMLSYKGDLYIPTGTQALWRWGNSIDIETLSPARWATAESDFGGRVLALANDSEYLFAVTANSTKVEILAMRQEMIDGETDWRWHPIAELTSGDCNHAFVSTVGSKRLWLAGDAADTPTAYYLPANYADPTTDTTYNRNTSGTLYTPWYSGGFQDVNKAFFSLTLLSDNLDSNLTITASSQLAASTTWTALSAFNSNNATKYFAADTITKKIRFKLVFASNSATSSPVLRGLILRGALMPTKRKRFNFVVRVADNIKDRRGVDSRSDAATLATALKAYDAENWPIILRDRENTSYNVKVVRLSERETIDEELRNPERHFTVQAVECKLS